MQFGERSLAPGSILAFREPDPQYPDAISSITFFEREGVTCDDAGRALGDDGGGGNGLQISTTALSLSFATHSAGHISHTIFADVSDVTTGGAYFEKKMLTDLPLRGFMHVGDVELQDTGGSLYGIIHAEASPGEEKLVASVDGVFEAKVCGRPP